jgi:hypothetical protein
MIAFVKMDPKVELKCPFLFKVRHGFVASNA